jgi:hypothetical protein
MGKISFLNIIKLFLVLVVISFSVGCSGGGGGGGAIALPTGGDSSSGGVTSDKNTTQTSFAPTTDGSKVTFGAASFDAVLEDDLPVSKLATVSLVDKKITITDGKGVRAFEITLMFPDETFANFEVEDGDFITKVPAESDGVLSTISWSNSAAPTIASVTLTDADGNSIASLVK